MLQLAGFLNENVNLEDATLAAQQEAFRLMGYPTLLGRKSELTSVPERQTSNWSPAQEKNVARRAVLEYLTEYPGLLAGQRAPNPGARFAKRLPVEIAREFEQGFRLCPKGYDLEIDPATRKSMLNFAFGDQGHMKQLSRPLWMHQFQVTNELYEVFDGQHFDETARKRYSSFAKHASGPLNPVTYVDWYDSWCLSLWCSGRLPTEDEWEFACRAGTSTKYWSGPEDVDLDRVGWHNWNSGKTTHPVGEKAANAWLLYDTHGNVMEWGSSRCLRGGAFLNDPENCRSANRDRNRPARSNDYVGVRLSRAASD